MSWVAIVPAAGSGQRFGSSTKPKQYLDVSGKPLLAHTLTALASSGCFAKIVVAVAKDCLQVFDDTVMPHLSLFSDVETVSIPGGKTRSESVYNGLQAAKESAFAAIHDGARPCVRHELIDRLVEATEKVGAAVPGFPVSDTIKTYDANTGRIVKTMHRESLWAVQTPQCFRMQTIVQAYEQAMRDGMHETDDAAMVEKLGQEVTIVPCDATNIKVTQPEDLRRAQQYLVSTNA